MSWINTVRRAEFLRIPTNRAAWTAFLVFISSGCFTGGSPNTVDPKSEAVHITNAANRIGKYISANKEQVPKDTNEMKDWAEKNNIPEDVLLSTRDHQPYEVHYVPLGKMKKLVVTEKTGAKGKKFMWSSHSPSRIGMEVAQEDIDREIKPSPGGERPPGATGGQRPPR